MAEYAYQTKLSSDGSENPEGHQQSLCPKSGKINITN